MRNRPNVDISWLNAMGDEFEKPYMNNLRAFLADEYANHKIYPKKQEIFAALNLTPLHEVKVVILGQDPYHGPGQAHGLCFSVNDGIPFPPSLRNIFQELQSDVAIKTPLSGNLSAWAKQGVLLLNTTLTVREGAANSHQGKGWDAFTDRIIHTVNGELNHVVFFLWGRFAQQKASFIHTHNHLVLKAAHPSPLSAYSGFFGCKHFSIANQYLTDKGKKPINWQP